MSMSGRILSRAMTTHPLDGGIPPRWADAWGDDAFGPFAEFEVKGVVQRMRWVPPGDILWPTTLPDRKTIRKGPPRRVRIDQGFWIFDTPCTNALWIAVMDYQRETSASPRRPAVFVNWSEAREFAERLSARLAGLTLALPSEDQWALACRRPARDGKARDLKDEAWLPANSKKQPHDVATKPANAWGLFDMIGNVWEWCDGTWEVPGADPARGSRVASGGSWRDAPDFDATGMPNYTIQFGENTRAPDIGFRLAESRAGRVIALAKGQGRGE